MTAKKKYDKVCYNKVFLKEVILRIDFPAPVSALAKTIPAKLSKAALSLFPVSESQQVQAQELQFSATGVSASSREETQWIFNGKDREKTLVIAQQHMVFTTRSYRTYEEMADDFFSVLNVLQKIDPDLIASRMGLRYINIIDLPDGDPLDWDGYIEDSLLGMMNFNSRQKNLSRAFHVLEYNFEEMLLKCQFGMANPDYPAIVRRRQFVLDLDAFSTSACELDDLPRVIDEAHAIVQDFFESSIGEQTRKIMKQRKHARKAN
ncbi:TIGR04255 family protein [Zwartia sp.]|uniref:TIGR04255 family protein n=1 Tax=Zwartia sp. TaxID=2978004 RepID=UPI003BB15D1B